jgi:hypothetical protein
VRYERLASVSVSHLYNLRRAAGYQAKRLHWTKTKSQPLAIGERRVPAPEGRTGFIRIDSVHQGATGTASRAPSRWKASSYRAITCWIASRSPSLRSRSFSAKPGASPSHNGSDNRTNKIERMGQTGLQAVVMTGVSGPV